MPDYEPVGVKFTTQGLNKFLSDFTKANESILSMKAATESVDAANKNMMDGLASIDTQTKKTIGLFDGFAEGAQEVAAEMGGVAGALGLLGPEGAVAGVALNTVSKVFSGIVSVISNVVNGIKNLISTMANLAGKAINTVVTGIRNFVNWLMQGRQAAKDASDGIGLFDIALGNVVGNGISAFISGIQRVIEKVQTLGSQILQTSGRVEQMTQVAIMMGSRSGETSQQIQQLIQDIRDKGIEAEVATNLIIDLSRANIDLAQSTQLARVAQDAAVISNSNSSETLERLKYAIMTTQTEVARTAGITINADQAYKEYAETLNKTASELTSVERQQAFFNAILEEGEKISGAYEVSLNSGYKVMLSMERVYDDLAQTVGGPFQQAFFNVERTQYDLLRAFNMLMEEGTALNDILTGIGATVAAITEPFRLLATNIYNNVKYMSLLRAESEGVITPSQLTKLNEYREYIRLLATDMSNFNEVTAQQAQRLNELKEKFGEMTPEVGSALNQVMSWLDAFKQKAFTFAKNAFDWGFNIVVQFAEGIINAASSVLTGAMNAITNMLTYWLAPGSPPRVAPDLDTWGLEAMNSWLGGFSDADYSILSDIGDSLRSAFDLMLGDDEGKASAALADISKQLMEAFSVENMGGTADFESIFANIKGYAGDLSSNLITLTQQEIAYGRVLEDVEKKTKAVEAAEKALEAARESESDSLTKMNNVMDEYNELARSGASKEVLAAKRKEFTDAKNAYKTAKNTTIEKETELTASQKTLSTAQESLDIEKEKLDVLQKQNSQIMEILELQKRAAEAAIRAATTAGGGAGLASSLAAGGLGTANITELINQKLEEMKKNISDIFASKFPALVDLWNNVVIPAFDGMKKAWNDLKDKVLEVWDAISPDLEIMGGHFKSIAEHVKEFFDAFNKGDTKGMEDALEDIGKHLSTMWELHIKPFLDDTWDKFKGWWDEKYPDIKDKIDKFFIALKDTILKDLQDSLKNLATEKLSELKDFLINTYNTGLEDFKNWLRDTAPFLYTFINNLSGIDDKSFNTLGRFFDKLVTVAENANSIREFVGSLASIVKSFIQLSDAVSGRATVFSAITSFINSITGIRLERPTNLIAIAEFLDSIADFVTNLSNAIGTTAGTAIGTYFSILATGIQDVYNAFPENSINSGNTILAMIQSIGDTLTSADFGDFAQGKWEEQQEILSDTWNDLWDTLTRHSIIPDMIADIKRILDNGMKGIGSSTTLAINGQIIPSFNTLYSSSVKAMNNIIMFGNSTFVPFIQKTVANAFYTLQKDAIYYLSLVYDYVVNILYPTMLAILEDSLVKIQTFSEGASSSLQGIINTCYGAANALYYLLGAAQTLYDWSQKNDIGINVGVGSGGSTGSSTNNKSTSTNTNATRAGFGFAKGSDFIVPPGYEQDTFPAWVSSGERVIVMTKDQQEKVNSSYADAKAAGFRYANQVSNTYNNNENFNLSVSTQESPGSVMQTFGVMRILAKSRN